MPANAGIQVRFGCKSHNRLDSGFRRNDGKNIDSRSANLQTLVLKPRAV